MPLAAALQIFRGFVSSRKTAEHRSPPASGQRNAGRWLAGARFLQVLNEGHFGMREGAWQG